MVCGVCVFVGEAQLIDKSQPSLLYGGALYSQHTLRFQEIKQNIGFGLESMKVWFDTIVEAQHLTPDRCIMVSMGRHSRNQKQNQANKNISTGKHQTWSRSDLRTGLPGWLLVQNSVCIEPEPMAGVPRPQATNSTQIFVCLSTAIEYKWSAPNEITQRWNKTEKKKLRKTNTNMIFGATLTRTYSPRTRGEVLNEKCNPLALNNV